VSEGAPADDAGHGSFLREAPVLVLIALAVALLIKTFLVQAFFIPSGSMQPTLFPGDRVLVLKPGGFDRQDTVVFRNPDVIDEERGWLRGVLEWLGEGLGVAQREDEHLIKRVIGLPGDTVEIRRHRVFVNGERLEEPYLTDEARACNTDYPARDVPAGRMWVLGDNRCHSGDSRFGLAFVPVDNVVGRAFVLIWPPSHAGGIA
jgi:signal peptidase I